jgi:hypothetical protein
LWLIQSHSQFGASSAESLDHDTQVFTGSIIEYLFYLTSGDIGYFNHAIPPFSFSVLALSAMALKVDFRFGHSKTLFLLDSVDHLTQGAIKIDDLPTFTANQVLMLNCMLDFVITPGLAQPFLIDEP